jgi:hypothetical protein
MRQQNKDRNTEAHFNCYSVAVVCPQVFLHWKIVPQCVTVFIVIFKSWGLVGDH